MHLENGQRVYFTDNTASTVTERSPPQTMLTAFFTLCQNDHFASNLLYNEVPTYYTWNKGGSKQWKRRQQGEAHESEYGIKASDAIGRVYAVHPTQAECYYLRLLLHTVKGSWSFEDLRTKDGQVYPTFQAVCQAYGLLEDDTHWDQALDEASQTRTAGQLRDLFAIMLITCFISDPLTLWNNHRNSLAQDLLFEERQRLNDDNTPYTNEIYNQCLSMMQIKVLTFSGNTLEHYGLPAPLTRTDMLREQQYQKETIFNQPQLQAYVDTNEGRLTTDQRTAFDTIMSSIINSSGSVFLDVPGGTGKTFLINLILCKVRLQIKVALAAASSGIAATLLSRGRTAHSMFKLPLEMMDGQDYACNVPRESVTARLLKEAAVVFWDECTMANKRSVEALGKTLRGLRENSNPFGGCTIIFSGDFRQILPVISHGTRVDE